MQANINIHSLELDCPDQHHVQELGQDLVCVLDQLKVKFVVGLGEGAGANILARWGENSFFFILSFCLNTHNTFMLVCSFDINIEVFISFLESCGDL